MSNTNTQIGALCVRYATAATILADSFAPTEGQVIDYITAAAALFDAWARGDQSDAVAGIYARSATLAMRLHGEIDHGRITALEAEHEFMRGHIAQGWERQYLYAFTNSVKAIHSGHGHESGLHRRAYRAAAEALAA